MSSLIEKFVITVKTRQDLYWLKVQDSEIWIGMHSGGVYRNQFKSVRRRKSKKQNKRNQIHPLI